MRIFVISDTHFGHEAMYRFVTVDGVTRVRSEFLCAADADAAMVARWNAVVTPQDHVWHLGDVTMDKRHLRIIKELAGHKRLILGNHDKGDVRDYRAAGFQKVRGYRWLDKWGILSHVPIHQESLGGKLNIHGHIHEKEPFGPQYRNVSVERTGYAPVLLESLRIER